METPTSSHIPRPALVQLGQIQVDGGTGGTSTVRLDSLIRMIRMIPLSVVLVCFNGGINEYWKIMENL